VAHDVELTAQLLVAALAEVHVLEQEVHLGVVLLDPLQHTQAVPEEPGARIGQPLGVA